MQKFNIHHYNKTNKIWCVNGGVLIVTETEYVLNGIIKKVASFNKNDVQIQKIPNAIFYYAFRFTDKEKSYDFYFYPKTGKRLANTVGLENSDG